MCGVRAYSGDLGRSPQWGPGADPLVVTVSLYCTVSEIFSLINNIKRSHVTVTTPTQGTICNLSAKALYGEPMYII